MSSPMTVSSSASSRPSSVIPLPKMTFVVEISGGDERIGVPGGGDEATGVSRPAG